MARKARVSREGDALSDSIAEIKTVCECGRKATVNARLDALEDERDERKKLTAVLSAEVDMLYEIFMSAALPQYLKDSVGERIAKMKAEILETAHDEQN